MSQSPWEYFTWDELKCHCGCGKAEMDPRFMTKIVILRRAMGRQFPVRSAYRCPDHNERVSRAKSRTGPHTTGQAMDIGADGLLVFDMLPHLRNYGFRGIGLQQSGANRYIHLDDVETGPGQPRPWVWSYG